MKMIYYKMFMEWNRLFERLAPADAGKLIKALSFFTDDLKANQTDEIDVSERIEAALQKAGLTDAEPALMANAEMCCGRVYDEFIASLAKSETNRGNAAKGGTQKRKNEQFETLWEAYPNKVDKEDAQAAFNELDADAETFSDMLDGLNRWKASAQWQEKASSIPYLANWIRKKRWQDEPQKPAKKKNNALNYEQKEISKADFDALVVSLDSELDADE